MGTESFPAVKSGRDVTLTPHPLLMPRSIKSRATPLLPSVPVQYSYTSTPAMGRTACTEPQCLYSTVIPLLPLWVVRPLQSLSTWTVQLYLYSPYGPYGLYGASVPVQYSYISTPLSACTVQLYLYSPQCLYSTAIPLLPSVPVQYSYTSTPHSTCTVQPYLYSPQYLYSTAIPLLPSVPVQWCTLLFLHYIVSIIS